MTLLSAADMAGLTAVDLSGMPDTCTITTVTIGNDGGGGMTETETTATAKCRFVARAGSELVSDQVREQGDYFLFLPLATVIANTARVTFHGRTFIVVWTPPNTNYSTSRTVGTQGRLMPFTIPDNDEAFSTTQAVWMQTDINALVDGHARTGVVSGCAVTAQGSPNMTVAVASGVVQVAGQRITVASGNVTITTADSANPRLDLIVVSSAGVKSCTAGVAASAPKAIDIPASSVLLAMVYVPAGDTTIASNQITDKRVLLDTHEPAIFNARDYGLIGDGTTDDSTALTAFLTTVNTAGGGIVYFPQGVYITSVPIMLGSSMFLRGDGVELTTIRLKAQTYSAANGIHGGVNLISDRAASQTNMHIAHLTLDQNVANCGMNAANRAGGVYDVSMCIDIRDATRVSVERVRVINAIKYSMHFWACNDLSITHNNVLTGQTSGVHDNQDGIHTSNCHRVIMADNVVDTGTSADGDDCFVARAVGSGYSVSDVIIANNIGRAGGGRLVALVSAGGGVAGDCNVTNVVIDGNLCWASQTSGISLVYYSAGGIFKNIAITGNVLNNLAATDSSGHGIHLMVPNTTDPGWNNVSIIGNTMQTMTSTNNAAISIGRGSGLVVANNTFRDIHGDRGIMFPDPEAPVTDFVLSNNRFDFTAAATGNMGILLGKGKRGIITNNTLTGNTTGGTRGIFMMADATNGCTDVQIQNNFIDGFTTGIEENNSGANPDYNTIAFNDLRGCTTALSLLGPHNIVVNNQGGGERSSSVVYANTAAGTALASSTSEVDLVAGYSIPANTWRVGQVWRVTARGVYGTTTGPPNLTLKVKIGSVVAATTGVTATVASVTNRGWQVVCDITVISVSTTGTVEAQGMATVASTALVAAQWDMEATAVSASINMTGAANVISVSGQWGTNNVANTIQCRQMVIERMN